MNNIPIQWYAKQMKHHGVNGITALKLVNKDGKETIWFAKGVIEDAGFLTIHDLITPEDALVGCSMSAQRIPTWTAIPCTDTRPKQ